MIGRYFILLVFISLSPGNAVCASGDRVPLKYIAKYYPPADKLSSEYPDFFMKKPVRVRVERERLLSFLRKYNLQDEYESKLKTRAEKRKVVRSSPANKKKKRAPKRWVWGFYFNNEDKMPLINVNGRFFRVHHLFPGRDVKVMKVRRDQIFVVSNGKTYKIEVGSPLPF